MSSPRLLILCEYASLNGGEQSLLSTLPTVLDAGFDVSVALPSAGPFVDRLKVHSVRCIPFHLFDTNGERLPREAARRQLAAMLHTEQPALLHANSLAMGRLSGPVARELGLSSLAHLRDIIKLNRAAIEDLNCHTRLLAVSEATRKFHIDSGLNAAKTRVLYNGVDLEQFRPRASTGYLHQELKLPADSPLIATIGQLGLRKDPLTFLQAATAVAASHPAARFLIIGERFSEKEESRELERELHSLATQEPLAGRVHFLGIREDLPRLLPELTLLVHAARQEPLGRVLLEGAAAGRAIVASDVGGTREIFPTETESVLLFSVGDVAALTRALAELLDDPRRRQCLQANARVQAERMFDVRLRAAELVRTYRELLTNQRTPGG